MNKTMLHNVVIIAWLCVSIAVNIYPNSCDFPRTPCEKFSTSDEVFLAKLIKKEEQNQFWVYSFEVNKVFKGRPEKKTIGQAIKDETMMCVAGPNLKAGNDYLVFTSLAPNGKRMLYGTDNILTKLATDAQDEIKLFSVHLGQKRIASRYCQIGSHKKKTIP